MKDKKASGTIRGRLADGTANPVDLHVGLKLKEARLKRGLSQERLAEEMGITFQQIQKYEKGLNRIGASRLWDLAQVLGEPIEYFYKDMNKNTQDQSPRKIHLLRDSSGGYHLDNLTLTPEDLELLLYFKRIQNPQIAKNIIHLIQSLSFGEIQLPEEDEPDDMDDGNPCIDD